VQARSDRGHDTGGADTPGDGGTPTRGTTDTVAPRLLSLTLSLTAFAAFSSAPSVRDARSRGTSVTSSLSDAAMTMFRVQRVLAGRRVRGGCMRPTRANRRSSRCERHRTLGGSFRHTETVGSTDSDSAAASAAAPGDRGATGLGLKR
jgi:hypothetical protein